MLEHPIQRRILADLGSRSDIRLFRNNVGAAAAKGRFIRYGLHRGSSDLIGFKSVHVTPDMVGKTVAVFLSIETKRPGQRPKPHQFLWLSFVKTSGGIAGYADSVEKAREVVDGA
jgi:hypothetical protein